MNRQAVLMITLLQISISCFGQKQASEIFLNAGINVYIPRGSSPKSMYPVLGYNRDTKPKILLGGVGLGAMFWKPIANNLNLKVFAGITKQTYWDEPVLMRDAVGRYVGAYQAGCSDYVFGAGSTVHYTVANRLSIGAGVGAQVLLLSLSRMPEMYGYGVPVEPSVVANQYYKRVLPVVPLEVTYRLKKVLLNLRYEAGLLNRMRGELAKNKSDKFDLITFEVGFALK